MPKFLEKKRSRPGAISLLIFCFLGSAVVRVVDFAPALAQEMGGNREYLLSENDHIAEQEINASAACGSTEEPSVLLGALQARQAQIVEREAYIDGREQTLRVAEARIAEQLIALRGAEESLAATLALADNAAENDVAQLTEVYERMKPADAAGIFETMDIQFAAGFFARMRPDSAANIMAELPSDLAYSISVVMGGRNANAPRE